MRSPRSHNARSNPYCHYRQTEQGDSVSRQRKRIRSTDNEKFTEEEETTHQNQEGTSSCNDEEDYDNFEPFSDSITTQLSDDNQIDDSTSKTQPYNYNDNDNRTSTSTINPDLTIDLDLISIFVYNSSATEQTITYVSDQKLDIPIQPVSLLKLCARRENVSEIQQDQVPLKILLQYIHLSIKKMFEPIAKETNFSNEFIAIRSRDYGLFYNDELRCDENSGLYITRLHNTYMPVPILNSILLRNVFLLGLGIGANQIENVYTTHYTMPPRKGTKQGSPTYLEETLINKLPFMISTHMKSHVNTNTFYQIMKRQRDISCHKIQNTLIIIPYKDTSQQPIHTNPRSIHGYKHTNSIILVTMNKEINDTIIRTLMHCNAKPIEELAYIYENYSMIMIRPIIDDYYKVIPDESNEVTPKHHEYRDTTRFIYRIYNCVSAITNLCGDFVRLIYRYTRSIYRYTFISRLTNVTTNRRHGE